MAFGGVGSRVFMDDLVFQRLWLQRQEKLDQTNEIDNEDCSDDEVDDKNDLRRLFPRRRLTQRRIKKINSDDSPEWLAVFVGVFFVAGVAAIASYQAYTNQNSSDIPHSEFHFNDIAHDPMIDIDMYDQLFLPKSLQPKSYLLYIAPNTTAKHYTGLVKITVKCKAETAQIIIHSLSHKIRKVEVKPKNKSESEFKVLDTLRNIDKEYVIFKVDKIFQIGNVYDILIGFGSELTYYTSKGFYLTDYNDGYGKQRTMVSTDFEPTTARHAFPCFDEPELKATFQVIVLHERESYFAISNMPIKKQIRYGQTLIETYFEESPVMSTYLVVFIVTEYDHRETQSTSGVKSRVYSPPGRLNEIEVAVNVVPLCIDYYEERFGVKYTLPKLDIVPIRMLSSSADETWGAIIFEESSLLYDSSTGSVRNLEYAAKVIAHEISHQWFGDLVTMTWWNDLWLKESFANYLEDLPIEKSYPSWDIKTKFYSSNIEIALIKDSSMYTHPIKTDEMNPNKLRLLYDEVTYEKGASVVSMLANFLGEEKFFQGVKIYLDRYAYKNANASQFWQAISDADTSVDVERFMHAWITKPGFPVLHINHEENGKFKVSQHKYMQFKKNNGEPESSTWEIPLVIKTKETNASFSTVFNTGHSVYNTGLSLNNVSSWYKANYGGTGFYRVNYEENNWNNLLTLFNTNHLVLSALDRASILSDITALSIANYQNIDLALDFTRYLSKEHHYVPWETGMKILGEIHSKFHETDLKICVETYLQTLMGPVLDYLNAEESHDHLQQQLISLMLSVAVEYNNKEIVNHLNNKFLKWVVSGSKIHIPSSLRSSVLVTGIKYGEKYEWEYLFKYYTQSSSSTDRNLILEALTTTSDLNLIKKILHVLNSTTLIPISEQDRAYQYICSNRYAQKLAWQQVKSNFNTILTRNRANPRMTSFILDACLSSGKTETDLNEAKDFVKEYLPNNLNLFGKKIEEQISRNIQFMQQKSNIENWFKRNNPSCFKTP